MILSKSTSPLVLPPPNWLPTLQQTCTRLVMFTIPPIGSPALVPTNYTCWMQVYEPTPMYRVQCFLHGRKFEDSLSCHMQTSIFHPWLHLLPIWNCIPTHPIKAHHWMKHPLTTPTPNSTYVFPSVLSYCLPTTIIARHLLNVAIMVVGWFVLPAMIVDRFSLFSVVTLCYGLPLLISWLYRQLALSK